MKPAESTICWTSRVRGRSVITVGMRLISQIPSGRPMIVIIANQAIVDTMPVSHQPTKMNHSARTQQPRALLDLHRRHVARLCGGRRLRTRGRRRGGRRARRRLRGDRDHGRRRRGHGQALGRLDRLDRLGLVFG